MFKRIKDWRQRRIEQKLKKRKERNGKIISSVLGIDKISDEGFNAAMRLEGHKYKTATQYFFDFEKKRRNLGLEALLESRRISAEFHNPEGVLFFDLQSPEGYSEEKRENLYIRFELEALPPFPRVDVSGDSISPFFVRFGVHCITEEKKNEAS